MHPCLRRPVAFTAIATLTAASDVGSVEEVFPSADLVPLDAEHLRPDGGQPVCKAGQRPRRQAEKRNGEKNVERRNPLDVTLREQFAGRGQSHRS